MTKDLIIVSSVTYAMKAKEILQRHGFHAYIMRLPKGMTNIGCGYCVYVDGDTDAAENILRKLGLRVLGRYVISDEK